MFRNLSYVFALLSPDIDSNGTTILYASKKSYLLFIQLEIS